MSEVELYPRAVALSAERDVVDGWMAVASDVIKLANVIAPTEFVPEVYRDNPPAVAAAILAGRELGIGPMTSLRHVQVVKGSPSLSAEYKRARVLAAGHEFDIIELNTTRCRVAGRRRGSNKPPLEITFTLEDARIAGLIKDKGAWRTRPRRMLFARAGSELCDFLFADVVNGMPTAELVADGTADDEFAGYDEAPGQTSPAPAPRTAQRRQRTAKPPETPAAASAHQPEGSGPSAAAGLQPTEFIPVGTEHAGLPPLPGEDEPDPATSAESSSADPNHPQPQTSPSSPASAPGPRPPSGPDEHGTATRGKGGQLTALWTILQAEFGFAADQKDQARVVVEHIIGRDLDGGTTGDLSYNEARTVLDTLSNWIAVAKERGESPHSVLIAAMVAAGQAASEAGDG
jgi:hypothetical protein